MPLYARARRAAGFFNLETVMSWTNERVERLKTLWAQGQSASAIAAALGQVTRNAVIGKVHRLGLARRSSTSRCPRSLRRPPATRWPKRRAVLSARLSSPPPLPTAAVTPMGGLGPAPEIPVTVATLTGQLCRWPEGDPKEAGFHFCGRRKAGSPGPYCGAHAAIAYR
jgi:GcrA cell cycle regulator